MQTPDKIDWIQVRRFSWFLAISLLVFVAFARVYKALIVPFAISVFFSYILLPIVDRLAGHKIPRALIVALIQLLTLIILVIAFSQVIPTLYGEILDIIKLAPGVFDFVSKNWIPSIRDYVITLGVMKARQVDQLIRELGEITQVSDQIQQALATIWNKVPQVLGTVVNVVMIPLMTFFLLKDYHKVTHALGRLIPADLRSPVSVFVERVTDTFNAVIKGQVMVAVILGVLYIVGFSIVGLNGAFAIGLVAGICRLIPYFDVIVGGSLALLSAFSEFHGFGQLLGIIGVFFAIQSLDGMIITPRVVGERVGLHPLVVIVSIIAFGEILGFWGVILAIPIVAVAKVLLKSAEPFYFASKVFNRVPPAVNKLQTQEQQSDLMP